MLGGLGGGLLFVFVFGWLLSYSIAMDHVINYALGRRSKDVHQSSGFRDVGGGIWWDPINFGENMEEFKHSSVLHHWESLKLPSLTGGNAHGIAILFKELVGRLREVPIVHCQRDAIWCIKVMRLREEGAFLGVGVNGSGEDSLHLLLNPWICSFRRAGQNTLNETI